MKKLPVSWILIFLAAFSVMFGTISYIFAMSKVSSLQERADRTQLDLQASREEIVEIQNEKEKKAEEARQKALNEKKRQKEQAEESAEESAETAPQEDAQQEKELPEENINSFSENRVSGGKVIGIDPGHQGSWVDMSAPEPVAPGSFQTKARCTTGTTGNYTGLPEYELNLSVSLKLKEILQERGYQVVMTREVNDANISNSERARKAAQEGAEIYVRIHANSDSNSSVNGALTMCSTAGNPYVGNLYQESRRLSQVILDSYCQATGFAKRDIIETDNMTGINWSTVPVTIVEMGFMSNKEDDERMADTSFQQTMAEGIANGIDAYFGEG